MYKPLSFQRRLGLTLIELVSVIAIIVILASIIIPTASTVLQSARRAKAANQLRQIALSAAQLLQENPGALANLSTKEAHAFPARLAYLTGMNQASLYFIEEDPALSQEELAWVILDNPNDPASLNKDFKKAALSFAFSSKIAPNALASTTPIAWTRGLRPDGTWDPSTSPYGGQGGHIAFLDGHVKWYKKLDSASSRDQLMRYGSTTPTLHITEALPPGAIILEASSNLELNSKE